ncbi:MAG: trimethylamine methyltransferase family protein [Desulfobacteraceae bacterium]|jgi:trimethylamine--corrinoid protein Co-methyltransferase
MMLLSEDKIRDIDLAGRRVLERVGLKILDQVFLERLKTSGCQVNPDSQTVQFPEAFLDQTLSEAPSQFTLCSRDGQYDLNLGAGNVYFGNGGRVFQVLDTATGEYRPTVLNDVVQTANLVNNLEHINFYIIACQAHDLDPAYYHLNDFFCALNHTTKHVMGGCDTFDGITQVWGLISFLAGGEEKFRQKPFVSIITNPISPLTVDSTTLQILEFCSVKGIPVTFAPAPIAGVTAPVSLAGALAQMHAEALAGVALSQFFSPGAKVMYGSVPMAMDLRNMNLTTGSAEVAMMNAVAVRLAKLYDLPIYASAGLTESKSSDLQAGLEKAISCLLVGLAGADYVHLAAGMLDSGNSISYEQYVIDNEVLGMIHRILAGIDVNGDTMGFSCIEKIGPGGSFVTDDHTVEYMFKEYFYPQLAVRSNFDQWEGSNRPTLFSRASAKIQEWRDNQRSVMDPKLIAKIKMKFPQIVDL